MSNLVEIFCNVDYFCMQFCPQWQDQLIADGTKKRIRHSKMTISERMAIVIVFHQSNHRDFKNFYVELVQQYWFKDFPNLLSYNRFINTMSALIVPMCAYFQTLKGKQTGIAFIDSTSLKVSHNIRIPDIKYLKILRNEVKVQWNGFLALNFTY